MPYFPVLHFLPLQFWWPCILPSRILNRPVTHSVHANLGPRWYMMQGRPMFCRNNTIYCHMAFWHLKTEGIGYMLHFCGFHRLAVSVVKSRRKAVSFSSPATWWLQSWHVRVQWLSPDDTASERRSTRLLPLQASVAINGSLSTFLERHSHPSITRAHPWQICDHRWKQFSRRRCRLAWRGAARPECPSLTDVRLIGWTKMHD